MVGVKFSDLIIMDLRKNYHEKHVGKKFYYSKSKNSIFVWNITTAKWEIEEDASKLKYLFINNDIIQHEQNKMFVSSKGMSFSELGIDASELEEIDLRFRDGCVHYIHKTTNKIFSCNNFQNYWFIPSDMIQSKIFEHINNKQ